MISRLIAVAAVLAAVSAPASAQQKIRLTIGTGFPLVQPFIADIPTTFIPAVNRYLQEGGNKYVVDWNLAHSGTLFKVPGSLDAASSGQADIVWMGHVFEPTRLPLQNVGFYAPFSSPDHRLGTRAVHEMHQAIPGVNRHWNSYGVVYLTSWANDNYVLMSKFPVASLADLKGRKVGGAGPNLAWLKGAGAAGVVVSFATVYNDMKSGIFDAVLTPPGGAAAIKLHEVAPYVVNVNAGAISAGSVIANKASFDRWPNEVQQAIRRAADDWQRAYLDRMDKVYASALETMTVGGAKVTPFSRDDQMRWAQGIPTLAQDWVKEQESKGLPGKQVMQFYMDFLRKNGAQPAFDWDKF